MKEVLLTDYFNNAEVASIIKRAKHYNIKLKVVTEPKKRIDGLRLDYKRTKITLAQFEKLLKNIEETYSKTKNMNTKECLDRFRKFKKRLEV